MELEINDLRERLAAKHLDFSHVAMKNTGEILYRVDDIFISPAEAESVALGAKLIEELRDHRSHDFPSGPTAIAWIAATQALTPAVKALYDISKDGWEKLKPSVHLRVDVLDSTFEKAHHVISLSIENLSRSGIYIESVSIAKIVDESEKLSLRQPTVRFHIDRSATSFGDPEVTRLPILLAAGDTDSFSMICPPLIHNGQPRSYGVADLCFSKLDEPSPDYLSFTFRLRTP